jgi:hypothetical protein
VPEAGHQPFEAEAEPVDLLNTVVMVKAQHDGANHVVQSRAQPAAGHDPASQGRRVEEQTLAGTGALHRRTLAAELLDMFQIVERRRIQDAFAFGHESSAQHR